jgi:hypothetical protein
VTPSPAGSRWRSATWWWIAALSLWIVFANYGWRGDLIGGDANAAWALAGEHLRELLGVYVDHPGLGLNAAEGIQAVPVLALASALHALGLSNGVAARLVIALYFFVAISGAWNLGRALLARETERVRATVALAGALLYGLNHYTLHVYATAETYFPLGYVALPWLLYGLVDGCERHPRRGIATIALAVVFAGGVAMNPAFFGVALLVLPIGASLELIAGTSWRRVAVVAAGGLALGIALCAWWVLPAPTGFGAGLGQLHAEGSTQWVEWMSQRSSFAHLLRLDGYTGGDAYSFASWYSSPLGSLLGYVPFLVALAGAGAVRRRFGAAALLVFAALVFLGKGVHPPFGSAYGALMDHVPGFSIFRSPYDKWAQLEALMLVVVYDLGFAGVIRRATSLWAGRRFSLVAATCALPVVLYPWPAYAGHMLSTGNSRVSYLTVLPDDYRAVAAYLRQHVGDARALVLNGSAVPFAIYTWGYFGEDPLPIAAGVPLAGADVIPRSAILPVPALRRALDALSVRYLVVHDDVVNSAPSADAQALVAGGDARLVLRTRDLRVFERAHPPAGLVSLATDPSLIQDDPARADELAVDPLQTAQLVPNAAPALAGVTTTLLAPALDRAQAGDRAIGIAREFDVPAAAPGDSYSGAVAGNPSVAIGTSDRCGAHEAVRLRPPTEWSIGQADLPAFDRSFCLAHPLLGDPSVDGTPMVLGSSQVSVGSAGLHRVDVPETTLVRHVVGHALDDDGVTFAFVAPFAADMLVVDIPRRIADEGLFASVSGSDAADLGASFDQGASRVIRIPLVARRPIPGEICFLSLRGSERRLWPAIRTQKILRLALAATTNERFAFALDGAALTARSLAPGDLAGPVRERVNAPAGSPARVRPLLAWNGVSEGRSGWSVTGDGIDVLARARPVRVRASGELFTTDRYRLRIEYRSSAAAVLGVSVDGDTGARRIALAPDGRAHVAGITIHPPTGSSGRYAVTIDAAGGELRARVRFESAGPNASVYNVSPRSSGGRLTSWTRRFPWWFEVRVADCSPCVLRVGVSEPLHWLVRGARVLGTYEAAGQSAGMPWSGNVTGAATWVLDAGTGDHTIELFFLPALLAGAGVAIALAAAVAGFLLLARGAPAPVDGERPATGGPPAGAVPARVVRGVRVAVVVLAAAAALCTDSLPALGDPLAALAWAGLAALGAMLLL